jgi:DNA-directed RNA polymerase subunit RPC12/RpoP
MPINYDVICNKCGKHNINDSYYTTVSISFCLPKGGGISTGRGDYIYYFCIDCKKDKEKKIFDIVRE